MAWTLTDVTAAADLTAAVDAPTLLVQQRAYADSSRLTCRIRSELGAIANPLDHEILLSDGAVKVFGGIARVVRKLDTGVSSQTLYEVECQDYTTLLADDYAPAGTVRSTSESDKARITWLFATFGTRGIAIGASVQTVRATMPAAQDFSGLNLHQCLTLIASVTGGSFYVDFDKVLHYFTSEVNAAPFGLSDTPNNSTTFEFEQFSESSDTVDYINEVHVIYAGGSTTRYLGGVPPAAGTRRGTVINDATIPDLATAQARGDSLLATYGVTKKPSTLVTYKAGLKAGQYVQVTHSGWSISAVSYRIAGLQARPESKDRIAYTVDFGSGAVELSTLLSGALGNIATANAVAQQAAQGVVQLADLSVGGANLVPNSSFEDGSSWTVGAQWAIGFTPGGGQLPFHGLDTGRAVLAAQTAGDLVTPKIAVDRNDEYVVSAWRYIRSRSSGTFRVFVKQYDASNVLLATDVLDYTAADAGWTRSVLRFAPAAAISPAKIAWQTTTRSVEIGFSSAGAVATLTVDVDGVQLERGEAITAYAPRPQEIVAGSIGTTEIADDAVTTPKLIAGAVTTAKVAADAITANELAAGSVTADAIAAGAVRIGNLADDPGGNLVTNFGFEADGPLTDTEPTGWALHIGSLPNFDVIATTPSHGAHVLRITGVNGAVQQLRTKEAFSVQGGQRYRVGAWMRGTGANTAAAQGRVVVYFFDSTGTQISATELAVYTMGTSGVLAEQAAEIVAPTTAVTAKLGLRTPTTVATGDQVFFDDAFMYRADRDVIHANGNVRIDSTGVAVINGAITVQNAGATVIIDGTSNMFKILATGTQTLAWPAVNGSAATGVVLSGLGTFTAVPIVFSSVTTNASISTQPRQSQTAEDVDTASGIFNDRAYTQFRLDSGDILVTLSCESNNVKPVGSAGQRYYVCKEAAI